MIRNIAVYFFLGFSTGMLFLSFTSTIRIEKGNSLASEESLVTILRAEELLDRQIASSFEFAPADIRVNLAGSSYSGPEKVSSCSDCFLYPVGKSWALSPSYVPSVVPSQLPGGGSLTPETRTALSDLFKAANAAGHYPKINSAYRSYQTQVDTFNYWVDREVARGKGQAEAEIAANVYSARPGHSEHQLGTTVDIGCMNCQAFSRGDQSNVALWEFMAEKGPEYGFVVSYPDGKQELTGYTYEPWHMRYIGKELALEFAALDYRNAGNSWYLEKFLRIRYSE
ncbi:MAG: M15 family metallopeptidase [Candidatus Dojkabacteria bacterium]